MSSGEQDRRARNERAVASFEERHDLRLPPEYRDFLVQYGGALPEPLDVLQVRMYGRNNTVRIKDIYDVVGDISELDEGMSVHGDRMPPELLPVGRLVGGNIIALAHRGEETGDVFVWDHETEADSSEGPDWRNLFPMAARFTALFPGGDTASLDVASRARALLDFHAHVPEGQPPPGPNSLDDELTRAIVAGDHWLLDAVLRIFDRRPGYFKLEHARETALRGLGLIRSPHALRALFDEVRRATKPDGAPNERQERASRTLGALLGYSQGELALEKSISRYADEPALVDMFACWVQERVLRGRPVGSSPVIEGFWFGLRRDNHVFGELPLSLLDIETGLVDVAEPRPDVLGNWFDFPRDPTPPVKTSNSHARPFPALREVALSDDQRSAMASGMDNEVLFPNATFEARVFELDEPLSADLAAHDLRSLPIESLRDAKPEEVRWAPASARQVMDELFRAATQGGCYGDGRSAAFGRRYALRAMGALAGARPDAPFAEVRERALSVSWVLFEADTDWWNHVSVDLGIACHQKDRGVLSVLSGTDTD